MSNYYSDYRSSRDHRRKQLALSAAAALRIRCPECGASAHSDCVGIDGPGVHAARRVDGVGGKGRRRG